MQCVRKGDPESGQNGYRYVLMAGSKTNHRIRTTTLPIYEGTVWQFSYLRKLVRTVNVSSGTSMKKQKGGKKARGGGGGDLSKIMFTE